jgi:hypothetical protein
MKNSYRRTSLVGLSLCITPAVSFNRAIRALIAGVDCAFPACSVWTVNWQWFACSWFFRSKVTVAWALAKLPDYATWCQVIKVHLSTKSGYCGDPSACDSRTSQTHRQTHTECVVHSTFLVRPAIFSSDDFFHFFCTKIAVAETRVSKLRNANLSYSEVQFYSQNPARFLTRVVDLNFSIICPADLIMRRRRMSFNSGPNVVCGLCEANQLPPCQSQREGQKTAARRFIPIVYASTISDVAFELFDQYESFLL